METGEKMRRSSRREERKRSNGVMHVGGQTGAFLFLLGPLCSVGLHTHQGTLSNMKTEIGLSITSRQTDLKGQQNSLYGRTCLVTVTTNRNNK